MKIDLGVVVLGDGTARSEELARFSHLLLLEADVVPHPGLPGLLRRALERFDAVGGLAVPSSATAVAGAYDGTPAAYQRLLCTARRPRRRDDPVSFAALPQELWREHRGEDLERLLRRAETELGADRVVRDRSGLLGVRVVSEEVGSAAPPVPLEPPAAGQDGGDWRLSVVMPLRDRPARHLRASLAAWSRQTLPPAEVVVVDQGSAPDLAAAYREVARGVPNVRVLRSSGPPEWNKPLALNHGIRTTDERSTHVLTADCDLLFHPEALAALRPLATDGPRFVHGHRCDLPDLLGELGLVDERVWDDWTSAAKVVDPIADPWHLMPRRWAVEVRGFDERMAGRGYMDLDMSARAGRALETLRIGPGRLVALHYPHPRPDWFRQVFDSPETRRNRHLFNTDPTIVRNDADWGVGG